MIPPATVLSIQYLRAVAAIAVVIFHASNNQYEAGMAGVDVFFVISGFIMWTTTISKAISPAEFMRRRMVRIVPLYWVMTLFTAFITVNPPSLGLAADVEHLIRSLLFLPANIVPQDHPYMLPPVLSVGLDAKPRIVFPYRLRDCAAASAAGAARLYCGGHRDARIIGRVHCR